MSMSEDTHPGEPVTLCYKRRGEGEVLMDVWAPLPVSRVVDSQEGRHNSAATGRANSKVAGEDTLTVTVPVVLFFHGGGLTVGNRRSWFPEWLWKRFRKRGYLFISADYSLVPPATGYEIVEDIKDLWEFLGDPGLVFRFPSPGTELVTGSRRSPNANEEVGDTPEVLVKVQRENIIVAGTSAGGLCAYLCAMHCTSPPPKALLSMYGMGGDFLTPHYLDEKHSPFFRGRELLDPSDFREFIYPFDAPGGDGGNANSNSKMMPKLKEITDSPLSYHGPTSRIPGYPANPRMLLVRLYLQLGCFLDYYTGQHEPSLSAEMRGAVTRAQKEGDVEADMQDTLQRDGLPPLLEKHLSLFPQFSTGKWPRTVLLHGTADTAVPIHESRHLAGVLLAGPRRGGGAEVEVEVVEVEGEEHSFELGVDGEKKFGEVFERIVGFLCGQSH